LRGFINNVAYAVGVATVTFIAVTSLLFFVP